MTNNLVNNLQNIKKNKDMNLKPENLNSKKRVDKKSTLSPQFPNNFPKS